MEKLLQLEKIYFSFNHFTHFDFLLLPQRSPLEYAIDFSPLGITKLKGNWHQSISDVRLSLLNLISSISFDNHPLIWSP